MDKLEIALRELDEEWLATLPPVEKKYEHELSKKFLRWEQRVIYGKKSPANKVLKAILIAAALLVLFSVIALSTTKGREFATQFFKDSAIYSLYAEHSQDVQALNVAYLPEGFVLKNTYKDEIMIDYQYSNSAKWLDVRKQFIETTAKFDYFDGAYKIVKSNGISYIVTLADENIHNVIWNYNGYYYQVSGNIDKDTALKIAFSVE